MNYQIDWFEYQGKVYEINFTNINFYHDSGLPTSNPFIEIDDYNIEIIEILESGSWKISEKNILFNEIEQIIIYSFEDEIIKYYEDNCGQDIAEQQAENLADYQDWAYHQIKENKIFL